MSDPKLHYPKAVIIDADTFAIIASLIVFEFKENPSRYETGGLQPEWPEWQLCSSNGMRHYYDRPFRPQKFLSSFTQAAGLG